MNIFDLAKFRSQFPLLKQQINGNPLIYFDNGATTQKPLCVITKQQEYYTNYNANVHRAAHQLSIKATTDFEKTRVSVKNLINAKHSHEIIWTKGTTESINLVAQSWGIANLSVHDEIVLSYAEHHANIVPWQIVAEKTGAVIRVLPLDVSGRIDHECIDSVITEKSKIVCFSHISNVIGKINPIDKIIARAKLVGAKTLVDGAQAIANISIDVQTLDCDFYTFSAHKMYGPTGVGVLYGKTALLNNMPVYQGGGEMIKTVSFTQTSYSELPFKFEAGTPNIAGVIAFYPALTLINDYQLIQNNEHKVALINYGFEQLSAIEGLTFLVQDKPDIPLFSFIIKNHHQQDIASSLDAQGIAVRVGHHCAMPLMEYLHVSGCIRVSLSPYNTFEEIDSLISILNTILFNDECELQEPKNEGVNQQVDATVEIFEKLIQAKSWDSKHRELMLLGKSLTRMDKSLRNDQTIITGCESSAWLSVYLSPQGIYSFSADSDAKVIRGLIVVVLAALNNKTAVQISAFDMNKYFETLGLIQHLSPSRGNGLLAIVKKINNAAS